MENIRNIGFVGSDIYKTELYEKIPTRTIEELEKGCFCQQQAGADAICMDCTDYQANHYFKLKQNEKTNSTSINKL